MIVYKNKFEELSEDLNDQIQFKVNNTEMKLTKNYKKIRNILSNLESKNQEQQQMIEIDIPDLTTFYTIKYKDERDTTFKRTNYESNVLHSNFDGRKDSQKSTHIGMLFSFFSAIFNRNAQNDMQVDSYNFNEIINPTQINVFSLDSDNRRMVTDSIISIKQLQHLLDGYDIVIPDFLVDDMIKIAEKFEIEDLFEELNEFKKEIEDKEKYNRFSELEILIKLNEILKEIDEDNFNEKSSILFSISEYIGGKLLEEILNHSASLYNQKESVYLKICKMINSKFQKYDIKMNCLKRLEPQKSDLMLFNIISSDDVDSLQKQMNNPTFDISKFSFDLYSKRNSCLVNCNAIDCAAFFSSIKCFKYLLLNTELQTNNVSKLAIIGGNTEIIRICQQKKYDFKNTLSVAIESHQNDIAKWIFENKLDECINLKTRNPIYTCIYNHNYGLLQYFFDMKITTISKEEQIIIKYILYVLQYYHIDVCGYNYFEYFIAKHKSIKYKDDSGLIYCPIGKIIIINSAINNFMNDYYNEKVIRQPFELAAYNDDIEMLKFLFELKESHLLKSNEEYGFIIVKMMNDFVKSINIDKIENRYYDILSNSIYSGGIDIIKYLLDRNNIDININSNNVTLLHLAAIFNKVEIGKFLAEKIDINILDNQNHTLLIYAIKNHSNEFINFLLQQPKTDINWQDILFFGCLILFFNITNLCNLNSFFILWNS